MSIEKELARLKRALQKVKSERITISYPRGIIINPNLTWSINFSLDKESSEYPTIDAAIRKIGEEIDKLIVEYSEPMTEKELKGLGGEHDLLIKFPENGNVMRIKTAIRKGERVFFEPSGSLCNFVYGKYPMWRRY